MTAIDPVPYNALAALRAAASIPPRPQARRATLAAVHAAVAAAPPRRWWQRNAVLCSGMRHPLALATAAATVAAVAVVSLGWSAPPGSPLHDVRLARERVALVLAHDPTALRLSYAEERLREAHTASNKAPYLSEADDLLRQAQSELPASATDPLRARWEADERQLSDEGGAGGSPSGPSGVPAGAGGAAGSAPTPRPSGSDDHASGTAPGRPVATPSPGESEQRRPSPTGSAPAAPTPTGDGSEHHPAGTPGPTPTPHPDN